MSEDTIVTRIEFAMNKAKLKQYQLEEMARLGRGYLTKLFRGMKQKVDTGKVARIAEVCGVSFEWLSQGKGTPDGPPPQRSGLGEGLRHETAVARFEAAITTAFRHIPDATLADATAVREVMGPVSYVITADGATVSLVKAADAWVRAAMVIREGGNPVTFERLTAYASTFLAPFKPPAEVLAGLKAQREKKSPGE